MAWVCLAGLLALLGVGLELWCGAALGWRRALDLSDEPPDPALPPLVLGGPFAYVRHPQSLGLLLLVAAAALYGRTLSLSLAALVLAAVIVRLARRDERRLAERFGEAYARYRLAVGFLWPQRR